MLVLVCYNWHVEFVRFRISRMFERPFWVFYQSCRTGTHIPRRIFLFVRSHSRYVAIPQSDVGQIRRLGDSFDFLHVLLLGEVPVRLGFRLAVKTATYCQIILPDYFLRALVHLVRGG